jgi:hypothetical protein
MDEKHNIPLACAINTAIIFEVFQTEDFINASKKILKQHNIYSENNEIWPFFNLSYTIYIFYSFFVATKEIYDLKNDHYFYKELISENLMKDFIIMTEKATFNSNPSYHFNCFRNSISHLNYKLINDEMVFWDMQNKKKLESKHWEVKIHNNNLPRIFNILNQSCIKLLNEIKYGN